MKNFKKCEGEKYLKLKKYIKYLPNRKFQAK